MSCSSFILLLSEHRHPVFLVCALDKYYFVVRAGTIHPSCSDHFGAKVLTINLSPNFAACTGLSIVDFRYHSQLLSSIGVPRLRPIRSSYSLPACGLKNF